MTAPIDPVGDPGRPFGVLRPVAITPNRSLALALVL